MLKFNTPEEAKAFIEESSTTPCIATISKRGSSHMICVTAKYDSYANAIVCGNDLDALAYVAIEAFDKSVQRSERRRIRCRVRSQMYRQSLECSNN